MTITVEAVYENGVLKPKEPLPLAEHETVRVSIESPKTWAERTAGIIGWKGDHETLDRILAEAEDPL
jgi:predicted DNA-binding antitoxin AbrB/MazE fold protein